jgi:hypothetical protein
MPNLILSHTHRAALAVFLMLVAIAGARIAGRRDSALFIKLNL